MLLSAMLVSQIVLGTLFLRAGWSKIISPSATFIHIQAYQLLSKSQAKLASMLLPLLEIIVGLSCIVGFMLVVSSFLAIFLLCLFSVAILINLLRGRHFPCHCFGNTQTPIGIPMLLRNLLLLASGVFLMQQSFPNQQLTQTVSRWQQEFALLLHIDTFLFISVSLIVIFMLIAFLDEMSFLFYKR